jgi:hypothetical protein
MRRALTMIFIVMLGFGGCKTPSCGTQTYQIGIDISNQTGKNVSLSVTTQPYVGYLNQGKSPKSIESSSSNFQIELTAKESGFYQLWNEERGIPIEGGTKTSPGKCSKKVMDPRAIALVTFADENIEYYKFCRDNHFTRFLVLPSEQSCPENMLKLTREANKGPVLLTDSTVSGHTNEECRVEHVDSPRWYEGKITSDTEQKRSIKSTFAFNCDNRHWYVTLHCIDPQFSPKLSSSSGLAHCADSSGNIRKADSWTGAKVWDDVFCTRQQENKWVTVTSEAHGTTHYLFCAKPEVKYPWPWQITGKENPYRMCAPDKRAVFGDSEEEFICM